MNDAALRKWAERYPYTDVSVAILRILDESAAKDNLIAGQAERIAAQSDALSRVAEKQSAWQRMTSPAVVPTVNQLAERVRAIRQKVAALVIELDLMLAPPATYPLASVPITYGDPVPDYSRPPSLTPPAVVQMPGQLGAPDGLPMGEPAPESLATEDANLRNLEQSEPTLK